MKKPFSVYLFLLLLGGLDNKETLKEIIHLQCECTGDNFLPSLLVLGGLGIAVHFEQSFNQFDGVPLIMAYGTPVSGKSTAVETAMAVIGQTEKIGGEFSSCCMLLIQANIPCYKY